MLRRRFNGAKHVTEARAVGSSQELRYWVGERSIEGEVVAEAAVDTMEVRMPE